MSENTVHLEPAYNDESLPAARPWPRFWARTFDMEVNLWAVYLLLITFYPQSELWFLAIGADADNPQLTGLVQSLLLIPFALIIEAACFAYFGNTLGKRLLGLKVVSLDAEKPIFATMLKRAVNAWVFGKGVSLPFVALFTQLHNFKKVKAGEETSWDLKFGTRVKGQTTALMFVIPASISVLLMGYGLVNHQETVSQIEQGVAGFAESCTSEAVKNGADHSIASTYCNCMTQNLTNEKNNFAFQMALAEIVQFGTSSKIEKMRDEIIPLCTPTE